MVELIFCSPQKQVMVDIDEKTGKLLDLYTYVEDSGGWDLGKYEWKKSHNPLFVHAANPDKVFREEVRYWILSDNNPDIDIEGVDYKPERVETFENQAVVFYHDLDSEKVEVEYGGDTIMIPFKALENFILNRK